MKILHLKLQNFRLHADLDLTFPESGVIGLIGDNEAGKSTVIEGIAWALYGNDACRSTKDTLRWFGAMPRNVARSELTFEVGGKTYRIDRTENDAKLFEVIGGTMIAETTSGVNGYVPGLVGMAYAEFAASYLVLQKDIDRLASMLPGQRQAFVRKLMGVDRIDHALKALRERKKELKQERVGLEAGLGERAPLEDARVEAATDVAKSEAALHAAKSANAKASTELDTVSAALLGSQKRKAEHDDLSLKLKDVERRQSSCDDRVSDLEEQLDKAHAAAARIAEVEPALAPLPGLREERDRLREARAVRHERNEVLKYVREANADVERLKAAIAELKAPAVTADEVRAALQAAGDADMRMETIRGVRIHKIAAVRARRDAAEQEAANLLTRLYEVREIGRDGPCPTCTRTLGDALDAVTTAINAEALAQGTFAKDCDLLLHELAQESDDEAEAVAERERADAEAARLLDLERQYGLVTSQRESMEFQLRQQVERSGRLNERISGFGDTPFDADRLTEVEAEVRRLEVLDGTLLADRGTAARIAELGTALEAEAATLATMTDQVRKGQTAVAAVEYDNAAHVTLTSVHERHQLRLTETSVALARCEEAHRAALSTQRRADAALAEYDERAGKLDALLADLALHEQADARLAAFRIEAASTIRPELEALMSGFVHLLSEGRHEAVEITEDFDAILYEGGQLVKVASGGAEDMTALAMRLALSQMIAERAGQPISLLFLDEPFGSQSETRRGALMALIRRLDQTFEQVFLISHVAETRDMVDHAIELEYDPTKGCTRLVAV